MNALAWPFFSCPLWKPYTVPLAPCIFTMSWPYKDSVGWWTRRTIAFFLLGKSYSLPFGARHFHDVLGCQLPSCWWSCKLAQIFKEKSGMYLLLFSRCHACCQSASISGQVGELLLYQEKNNVSGSGYFFTMSCCVRDWGRGPSKLPTMLDDMFRETH